MTGVKGVTGVMGVTRVVRSVAMKTCTRVNMVTAGKAGTTMKATHGALCTAVLGASDASNVRLGLSMTTHARCVSPYACHVQDDETERDS